MVREPIEQKRRKASVKIAPAPHAKVKALRTDARQKAGRARRGVLSVREG